MSLVVKHLEEAEEAATKNTTPAGSASGLVVAIAAMIKNLKAGLTVDGVLAARIDELADALVKKAPDFGLAVEKNQVVVPAPGPVTTPDPHGIYAVKPEPTKPVVATLPVKEPTPSFTDYDADDDFKPAKKK